MGKQNSSLSPHPLYQTIQTSGVQDIPLMTPEGLWGVDQLTLVREVATEP